VFGDVSGGIFEQGVGGAVTVLVAGAASLNQTPLDWLGNRDRIVSALRLAREQGIGLLCLPELCITGYGCEDAFYAEHVSETALDMLYEILPETRGLCVCLGLPLVHRNGLFNAACLVVDGAIAGFVVKQNLAGDGLHYEPRWFKPWPAGLRTWVTIRGERYPLGDWMFDLGGVLVGFEICEDAWVAKRPGAELALRGVDVIVNPSASHFAFGKARIRERFVVEGSRAFAVSYLYANLMGCESGRIVYDGGALIASGGELLGLGRRLSYHDVHVISANVDIAKTRLQRRASSSYRPALQAGDEDVVVIPWQWPGAVACQTPRAPVREAWGSSERARHEAFARVVALGLFDYMRKSRSKGFVLSLSGGADSSTCALLVHLMVHFGTQDLGLDGFKAKLSHVTGIAEALSLADLTRCLLTCVYQSTANSSSTTREAARELAHALGARFSEWDIDTMVKAYTGLVGQTIGRALDWQTDDLALQNVQARARGPAVWMLANVLGALLLTTSNRSEAAVGYATMDGDTCGGLSPIGGIDKAFVREWLIGMETEGLTGIPAFSVLALVNRQAPTAELRPAGQSQTDEADLMPYDVLVQIERAAIRDKASPLAVYDMLLAHPESARHTPAQWGQWITRFFRLWCQSQWKRERFAPAFHLDDQNLDPKTWCRFPILSGHYELELQALAVRMAEQAASSAH